MDGIREAGQVTGSHVGAEPLRRETLLLNESELGEWGIRLGESLRPPCCIALSGELGAGKTTLVRAICKGYGVQEAVTSPTFALIHRYNSDRSSVYHIDLYRLSGLKESLQLGLEEIIDSHALTLIEWPERAEGALPDDTIRIAVAHVESDPTVRQLVVK
jgi:tRNA threonylcarbamoyladenosine biosynthesis protein TsaE